MWMDGNSREERIIKNIFYFYDYVSLLLSHMNIILEYEMNFPCLSLDLARSTLHLGVSAISLIASFSCVEGLIYLTLSECFLSSQECHTADECERLPEIIGRLYHIFSRLLLWIQFISKYPLNEIAFMGCFFLYFECAAGHHNFLFIERWSMWGVNETIIINWDIWMRLTCTHLRHSLE